MLTRITRTAFIALYTSVAGAQSAADSTRAPDKTFFTRRDAVLSAAAVGASAAVSAFDVRIAKWARQPEVQGSSSRQSFVDAMTVVNETPLTIAAVATYGIGRLTGSAVVADVGLHLTETLVLTVGISEVIRGTLGRSRPRVSPLDQYHFEMGKGFTEFGARAYPSIHAAAAFATAAALTEEVSERNPKATWVVGSVLYTAAMIPPLSRIYLDQHWASDIVAGGFLGALLGNKVVSYAHSHRPNKLDRWLLGVTAVPDGRGGWVVMKSID